MDIMNVLRTGMNMLFLVFISGYVTVANVVDCNIAVRQFEIQSRYYIHFWPNPLGKDMISLICPSYRLNIIPSVILPGWLWRYITHKC